MKHLFPILANYEWDSKALLSLILVGLARRRAAPDRLRGRHSGGGVDDPPLRALGATAPRPAGGADRGGRAARWYPPLTGTQPFVATVAGRSRFDSDAFTAGASFGP